ncbi:MAG TPA: hypothetical protein VGH52_04840 [Gaiellaceae bacterium]
MLFVCVGNQGRSLLAERLFREAAGDRHQARSAGSWPGSEPHSVVVESLREVGVDASDHVPQKLNDQLVEWADVVIATCDDSCPVVPGKRYENWQLADPIVMPIEDVRSLRDDIRHRVETLVVELDS